VLDRSGGVADAHTEDDTSAVRAVYGWNRPSRSVAKEGPVHLSPTL